MARVYREARTRVLPMDEAKGLTYLLSVMAGLVKDTTLEARVDALEERVKRAAAQAD
jgi:hypothetical protein